MATKKQGQAPEKNTKKNKTEEAKVSNEIKHLAKPEVTEKPHKTHSKTKKIVKEESLASSPIVVLDSPIKDVKTEDAQKALPVKVKPNLDAEKITKKEKSKFGFIKIFIASFVGFLCIFALLVGSLTAVRYYDLRQSRTVYQDYRSLFGNSFDFFEQYNYTKLRNEDYLKAEESLFPQLDNFASQVNSIETLSVLDGQDSDKIKTEVIESNRILREYIQQYKNLLNDAICLAKSNEDFNRDFGAFNLVINDANKNETQKVNESKQYLNTFSNAYTEAANCIKVLDVKTDLTSISDFYNGLNGATSLYEFSTINYREKNDTAINNIQNKFLKASQNLSDTYKNYYESYKVIVNNWDTKLTKANPNDQKLFRINKNVIEK